MFRFQFNSSVVAILLTLCLAALRPPVRAAADELSGAPQSSEIDRILARVAQEKALQPVSRCSDELFLRRVTLDLTGRIPTLSERSQFLANPNREALVDNLLASEEFSETWSELWVTQWYGYIDNNAADREALAQWLKTQIQSRSPYDEIVHSMISATGESAFDGRVNFLLQHLDEPVVRISRSFLGIRLDCARCHDHPFDRWKQDDFVRMTKFFDGIDRQEVSSGNIRLVDTIPETSPEERPRFLSGAEPRTSQWRQEFSLFLVKSRPFARNFANRIWYHLMGRGIVHPVDDISRDNPPAIPELLEWLTDESQRCGFDLQHMLKVVCLSEAYQRNSTGTSAADEQHKYFMARTIKPLPPEHLYASECTALGVNPEPDAKRTFVENFYGNSLDGDFSASWDYRETVQGLMSHLDQKVAPPSNDINELFLKILCRQPTPEELDFFKGSNARTITFVLLHSSEFVFNH